jgi:integrase
MRRPSIKRCWGAQDKWEAAALALYTGQRMSDVLVVRWSDIDQGMIAVVQGKTDKKLWIPIHKELAALLALLEQRLRKGLGAAGMHLDLRQHHQPILCNSRGTPWTRDGFKASWSEELNQPVMAELRRRRLVFHGLRKSAVVFLLEAGCTDAETAAITGQSRDMVEHYAKQVNQRRLAAAAILKWETADAARETKDEKEPGEAGLYNRPQNLYNSRRGARRKSLKSLAHRAGFEPTTPRFVVWCSRSQQRGEGSRPSALKSK